MKKTYSIIFKTLLVALFAMLQIVWAHNLYAQVPAGVNPNDLSSVKVDELSDDQIKALLNQGNASGVTIEQAEQMAISRGLPRSEAAKLRARINQLQRAGTSTEAPKATGTVGSTEEVANEIITENIKQAEETVVIKENKQAEIERPVHVYGQQLFRTSDLSTFDRSIDAKAPDNYVIGLGDEIGVSVFGYSYYNEVLKVDARGAINPNQMGPIFVKGLTFDKVKGLLRAKLGQYFDLSNNRVEITLAYSRSITVNIVGEVFKPGSYKIPALNTAFNALIIAGGPNDLGTLRNIQIRRAGKIIKTLDVYEFLKDPNSRLDFYLEDNDYILIPPAERIVRISGEVRRPMLYELKDKEHLNELITYASGFTATAYKEVIRVTRISPLGQNVMDVKLDSILEAKGNYKLQVGDEVHVRTTSDEIKNIVSIRGAVQLPGTFQYVKGERVSDLLKKAGGLRFETLLEKAYLIRTKPDQTKEFKQLNLKDILVNPTSADNLVLEDKDILTIASYYDFLEDLSISVLGEVRSAGGFDYSEGMTLGNALFLAGGLRLAADNMRIEISRISYFGDTYTEGDASRVIIELMRVPRDLKLSDEQLNFKLQPFDQVFVRTVPEFEFQQNMNVAGEVKYPGTYTILSKDERISDIIERAGGLTRFAFTEGASLYRPDLPGGYIVLNLEEVLKKEKSKYNYILKAGDRLSIPTTIDFIGIRGTSLEYLSVLDRSQVNAPYVKGKRARYYINEFGNGFTKDSWRRKTYVIETNAKITRTQNFLVFKVYPKVEKGSTIYVVNKEKKPEEIKKEREPFNWNKFIENTTLKVTGLATLIILLRQI